MGPGEIRRFYAIHKNKLDTLLDRKIKNASETFPGLPEIEIREGIVSDAVGEIEDRNEEVTVRSVEFEIEKW